MLLCLLSSRNNLRFLCDLEWVRVKKTHTFTEWNIQTCPLSPRSPKLPCLERGTETFLVRKTDPLHQWKQEVDRWESDVGSALSYDLPCPLSFPSHQFFQHHPEEGTISTWDESVRCHGNDRTAYYSLSVTKERPKHKQQMTNTHPLSFTGVCVCAWLTVRNWLVI